MRCRRTGLTLIEVLAATVLLGVLLAGVVVASARHTRQTRLAQDRLAALEVADRLLTDWVLVRGGAIDEAEGLVEGRPGWRWRVSGRFEPSLAPLGAHVGRLEIVDTAATSVEGDRRRAVVLASLEFVSNAAATAGEAR